MCGACGYLLRDLPHYCPRCGIKFQPHTALPAKYGNSKHTSELIETVRRMIGQILKVSITDGRVFVGRFICFDKQSNIILSECREYRRVQLVASEPAKEEKRNAGLVLLGGQYLCSVHLATGPEEKVKEENEQSKTTTEAV